MHEKERWIDISGYEGLYRVSSLGRIFSIKRNRVKSQSTWLGYKKILLSKDGIRKVYRVHRLVAMAFIPNPNEKLEVNHINEIKSDNRVENLEWVTREENLRHNDLHIRKANAHYKPISQYTLNGEYIKTWATSYEVSRTLGFDDSGLRKCANGKKNQAYGFRWEFV